VHLADFLADVSPAIDAQLIELEPFGLDGGMAPYPSVSQYAEAYAAELASVVDERDDVALVGYCTAGAVAFGIACELESRSYSVPLLVCLGDPRVDARDVRRAVYTLVRTQEGMDDTTSPIAAVDVQAGLDGDRAKLVDELMAVVRPAVTQRLNEIEFGLVQEPLVDELFARYRAWVAYLVAAADFSPSRDFLGDLHLFLSRDDDPDQIVLWTRQPCLRHSFNSNRDELLSTRTAQDVLVSLICERHARRDNW
jgi:hypothetical protein